MEPTQAQYFAAVALPKKGGFSAHTCPKEIVDVQCMGVDIMLWYVDHHGPCTSQRASATTLRWIYRSPSPFPNPLPVPPRSPFVHPSFLLLCPEPARGYTVLSSPFLHSLFSPLPCKLYSNKNICFNQLISASMENMATSARRPHR